MARRILRLLGTRYGLALVLLAVVLVVVGVARAISGPSTVDDAGPFLPPAASPTVGPTSELGDDSVATEESPPPPSLIPSAPAPEAVALDFARAWVRKPGVTSAQWRKGLEPLATPRLLDLLKDTDIASVPADAVRGPATVRNRDDVVVEYSIPVSPGLLLLTVIVLNGRWLVDRLDWDRP